MKQEEFTTVVDTCQITLKYSCNEGNHGGKVITQVVWRSSMVSCKFPIVLVKRRCKISTNDKRNQLGTKSSTVSTS